MFDYFKGKLVAKNFPYCSVEVNSIGYRFLVNERTISKLGDIDSEIKLYAKLIHKEDSMTLCGFIAKQDRVIFDILISVSGIGTKAALALLDEFETNELVNVVINEDFKAISRTKGIGPKMAQKIVLELKDKLTKLDVTYTVSNIEKSNSVVSDATLEQTIAILESLDYSKAEYSSALQTAASAMKKDDSQELLKETLKLLSIF